MDSTTIQKKKKTTTTKKTAEKSSSTRKTSTKTKKSTYNWREGLTQEQNQTLDKFIENLGLNSPDANTTFTKVERNWLDESCLIRYLKARDWNLENSTKMIKESLEWRKTFGPDRLTAQDVLGVMKLKGLYRNGFDRNGRPVIYMKPGAYNPFTAEERVRYLVWTLEDAIKQMPEGVEKLTWVMDFGDYANRAKSPEGRQTSRNSLEVLQNQYPERLGAAIMVNSPWFFSVLFTLMSPFMTSSTRKKIHWIKGTPEEVSRQLQEIIDPEQLSYLYGGKNQFQFEPEVWYESKQEEERRKKELDEEPEEEEEEEQEEEEEKPRKRTSTTSKKSSKAEKAEKEEIEEDPLLD